MAWKAICPLDDIDPASMKAVTKDSIEFLVLRGDSGRVLVVPPSCPHMQTPLCEGFFDGAVLTCSQHLWQWSVEDGSMQGIAEAPLAIYPSKVEGGEVLIDFEQELRYAHEAQS